MKILRFIVLAASLLPLLSGCVTEKEPKPVRVLMIGNSFSISAMANLPQVAESLGVPLDLTSLYIGGCSLNRHVANLKHVDKPGEEPFRPYQLDRSVFGKRMPQTQVNLPAVLESETPYDIITIQQASGQSWKPETYSPAGDELVAAIRRAQPQAKIYVQETWSYTPWSQRLAQWGIDQNEMYARLRDAYAAFARRHGLEEIRMGTAIQEWRRRLPVQYTENSFGGDVVGGRSRKPSDRFVRDSDNRWKPKCDIIHLNERGDYFQALVWAAKLFGKDVSTCKYRPGCVKESEVQLMWEIANALK